jgi:hypothetical protein
MQEMHRMYGFISRFANRTSKPHARQPFVRETGGACTSEKGGHPTPSVMEDRLMRTTPRFTFTWLMLVATVLSTSTGCLIPMYSGDPVRRAKQLIHTSEDLRAITDEWERIWFLDQPSHMKPYRTHGGIL